MIVLLIGVLKNMMNCSVHDMKTYEILNHSLKFFGITNLYFRECDETNQIRLFEMRNNKFEYMFILWENDSTIFNDKYSLQVYCRNEIISHLNKFKYLNLDKFKWYKFIEKINSSSELVLKYQLINPEFNLT